MGNLEAKIILERQSNYTKQPVNDCFHPSIHFLLAVTSSCSGLRGAGFPSLIYLHSLACSLLHPLQQFFDSLAVFSHGRGCWLPLIWRYAAEGCVWIRAGGDRRQAAGWRELASDVPSQLLNLRGQVDYICQFRCGGTNLSDVSRFLLFFIPFAVSRCKIKAKSYLLPLSRRLCSH